MSNRITALCLLIAIGLIWPLSLAGPAASQNDSLYAVRLPMIVAYGSVTLEPIVDVGASVNALADAGDGRMFAAVADGRVHAIEPDGTLARPPLLAIQNKVDDDSFEQGLLGLAFHPDFQNNGHFFVYYSAETGDPVAPAVLARYTVLPGATTADPASELILLTIPHEVFLHYGGSLQFGPDGYLYVSSGDGTFLEFNQPAPESPNAQDGSNLLGKILRLDVDSGTPYAIPSDNPYVGDDEVRDEIWHMGLRNPWRMSFDRQTGELYIADVGLARVEEINVAPAGTGGLNFGWPCYEGDLDGFGLFCGPATDYVFPIHTYEHSRGRCAITGGYVYRGQAIPWLAGRYLFTDFCTGDILALRRVGDTVHIADLHAGFGHSWATFGEGADGELYLGEYLGTTTVYRLVPGSGP